MSDQLDHAIKSVLDDLVAAAPEPPAEPALAPGLRQAPRPRWMLASAAAVLSVVAVGGLVLVQHRDLAQHPASPTVADPPLGSAPATRPTDGTAKAGVPDTTRLTVTGSPAPTVRDDQPTASSTTTLDPDPGSLGSEQLYELYDQLAEARTMAFQAIDRLTQQCLISKGFANLPTPTFLAQGLTSPAGQLIWSAQTPEEAAANGYRHADDVAGAPVTDPPAPGSPQDAALYGKIIGTWETDPNDPHQPGDPVGGDIYDGCLPTAQSNIIGAGDPKASYRINDYGYHLQDAVLSAVHAVTLDPQFSAVESSWVTCMRNQGFDAADVEDPPHRDWPNPRPSTAESAMAVADAACKASTGLTDTGDRLFEAGIQTWFNDHPDEYQNVVDFVSGVLARSTSELNRPS